jgi:hypothetical protein
MASTANSTSPFPAFSNVSKAFTRCPLASGRVVAHLDLPFALLVCCFGHVAA